MIVRRATAGDVPRIVQMGGQFYATTKYAPPYCEQSATVIVQLMLDSGILLVADDEGELIGMVGLVLSPFAFNFAYRSAAEVMWWVDPEARTGGAGLALLRAVDAACIDAGVHHQEMKSLATSPAHVDTLYRRLGYTPSEHSYTKAR